jgi:hypothetical protein
VISPLARFVHVRFVLARVVLAGVLLVGAAACSVPRPPAAGPAATARPAATAPKTAGQAKDPPKPVSVAITRLRAPDGSLITVATFRGPVVFALHDGSLEPGKSAGHVLEGPSVTGTERTRLIAAFNGGFELKSHAGGYEQEGHVAWPLQPRLASLLIDGAGQARIGVWGEDVPVPGQPVYSVRQNLWLLVKDGRPTAEAGLWWRWGGTIGGQEYVARSALGETATGTFMYAASMSTIPVDLAWALARMGARVAMQLDINPQWIQLAVAARPGGPLTAEVPGQNRPANQYLTGWTRDFIAVLAPAGG